MSYTGHSLGKSYHSTEMQFMYSKAPTDSIKIEGFKIIQIRND